MKSKRKREREEEKIRQEKEVSETLRALGRRGNKKKRLIGAVA